MITHLNNNFNINLLEVFGLSSTSDADKKHFFDDISMLVMSRVILNLKKELHGIQKEEFARLFEQEALEDARATFLKKYIPDIEERIFHEALIFKQEMKRIAGEEAAAAVE